MKNFLIYRSSAGSGKTYTLVKEYLKLVLKDPENVRHTLAITFTNKAADEMKSRIISSLIRLAENKDSRLLKQLKDEGVKCDIDSAARNVLNYILHNYTYFSVSTIDSFFQKVIRAFAKELKLTIGYSIELDTGVVLDKVVDDVFREIGDDEDITKYLVDFAYQNIDEDKGWHVDKNIKSLAGELFKERYWEKKLKVSPILLTPRPPLLIRRGGENAEKSSALLPSPFWRGAGGEELTDIIDDRNRIHEFIVLLNKFRFIFENKLIKTACTALELISKHGLEIDDFKSKRTSVAGYFRKLSLKDTYTDTSNIAPYEICKKILEGENEWYIKGSPKRELIEQSISAGLGLHLEDMVSYYEANFKKYVSVRVLLKTIYTVGIFSDVINKLNDYRDDNRTILISDSNLLLRSVINEESSPFVYEKIGEHFKNFLIDEFQDTSTFQWQNILPLVKNSLSEQNFSLVVGDVKQSIYRWRNGNMKLLLKDIENDLGRFKENIHTDNLTTNYRSKANVIEFNNRLFGLIPGILAEIAESGDTSVITKAYKNVKQEFIKHNTGGYVKAEFIPYEKDPAVGLSSHEKAGLRLVEIIKELVSEGVNPLDILVLTRKKDELREASLLLNSSGFRVVSDESLLLINSPKVKFLFSILRYLINNEDRCSKAEALYNYMLIENNQIIKYENIFSSVNEIFDSLIRSKLNNKEINNRSLYELVEYLMRTFGLNSKADLYILRFLDVILEYSSKLSQEINSFIQWWDENYGNYSIIVSGQTDAIRLMTIHKAKGLESPVVIIPYANWEINISSRDYFWVSSEEEPFNSSSAYLVKAGSDLKESYFSDDYNNEFIMTNLDNLNLLYVALTRAKDRLYVISPQKGSKVKNMNNILKSAFEMDGWFKGLKISENVYEFGIKEKIMHSEEIKNQIETSSMITSDFRKRMVIKEAHSRTKYFGIMLHKAFSHIKTKQDLEYAIFKISHECILLDVAVEDIKTNILKILDNTDCSKWFSEKLQIRNEFEFVIPKDFPMRDVKYTTTKRIDRAIIEKDKIIIIDFKTGVENIKKHSNQISLYKEIIKQASNKKMEAYLLYTQSVKVVKV